MNDLFRPGAGEMSFRKRRSRRALKLGLANSDGNQQLAAGSSNTSASRNTGKRRWPHVSAGLMCVVQALFLTLIFPSKLALMALELPPDQAALLFLPEGGIAPLRFELAGLLDGGLNIQFSGVVVNIPSSILTSILFMLFALPLLVAGMFFWQRKRGIWTTAVFMEGLILALSLVVYFSYHPNYIGMVMISGILAVFYLNTYDVQVAFQELPARREIEE
jgi:hypothetical protein